jgi:hypothetical protein
MSRLFATFVAPAWRVRDTKPEVLRYSLNCHAFWPDRALVADVEAGTPIHVFVVVGILPAQLPGIT